MDGVQPTEIGIDVARLAMECADAMRAFVDAQEAEAAVHFPSAARPRADGDNAPRFWCPLLGASCRSCACGTPQGAECEHLTYAGRGGKGANSGAYRVSRKVTEAAAARTAEAGELAEAAHALLQSVAGPAVADLALAAVRTGADEQSIALLLSVHLGASVLPDAPTRPAAVDAPTLPRRWVRKMRQIRAPIGEAVAAASGRVVGVALGWAQSVAAPRLAQAAASVAADTVAMCAEIAAPAIAGYRTQFGGHGKHARRARRARPAFRAQAA